MNANTAIEAVQVVDMAAIIHGAAAITSKFARYMNYVPLNIVSFYKSSDDYHGDAVWDTHPEQNSIAWTHQWRGFMGSTPILRTGLEIVPENV